MKFKYKFIIQEVAQLYMAVAIGEGAENFKGMIKLNATGKRIFELLMEGKDVDAVVATLVEEYNAPEADIRASVVAFVDKLKQEGVVAE